jgi:hypothetical protein
MLSLRDKIHSTAEALPKSALVGTSATSTKFREPARKFSMQTSLAPRILLLSSGPGETYAARLLKTESKLIAELETDDYYSLKQLHSCARELLYSGTGTTAPR